MRLLVASDNRGKLREYRSIFRDLPATIVSPHQIGLQLQVAEVGNTFAENASIKAAAYARASQLLTLADDSGLEVDALAGQPGVYSARYAGPHANDAQRIALLLSSMAGVPWLERAARFRCAIAITRTEGHVFLASGVCNGFIALTPRGTNGFGYDPVFYLPQFSKTMAQLPPALKNQLSHRATAARSARATISRLATALPAHATADH